MPVADPTECARLYTAGFSTTQIAARFQIANTTVWRYLHQQGIQMRNVGTPGLADVTRVFKPCRDCGLLLAVGLKGGVCSGCKLSTQRPQRGACRHCGAAFTWFRRGRHVRNPRLFCGQKCVAAWNHIQRTIFKDEARQKAVIDLYVKSRVSKPTIARMFGCSHKVIERLLDRAGIASRAKTSTFRCIEPGCSQLAKKIRHKGNGSMYGTLCAKHNFLHREDLGRTYAANLRRIARYVPAGQISELFGDIEFERAI